MKHHFAAQSVAVALALSSATAMACGHCPEDLIASVYDHALAQRTLALKHETLFFVWDGPVPRSDALRQKMMALAETVSGVDKGSARVSIEPTAMAITFAPQSHRTQAMIDALGQKFSTMKLSIVRLPNPKAP